MGWGGRGEEREELIRFAWIVLYPGPFFGGVLSVLKIVYCNGYGVLNKLTIKGYFEVIKLQYTGHYYLRKSVRKRYIAYEETVLKEMKPASLLIWLPLSTQAHHLLSLSSSLLNMFTSLSSFTQYLNISFSFMNPTGTS